jgi:beta-N-acetylhexosaminidase
MRGLFHIAIACACVAFSPFSRADEEDGWVAGRLEALSLREKIGQMFMVDVKELTLGPRTATQLSGGSYGNVILFDHNLADENQARILIRQLQDHAIVRTGVPMLVSVDQEGGPVNRLGHLLGLKSARHSARTIGRLYAYAPTKAGDLVTSQTTQLAHAMRRIGFNMNLAPVLDLASGPDAYIYDRSYGDDPAAVAAITQAYARAMAEARIITTGKHFPNLSLTRTDSHKALPVLKRTLADLSRHELLPFKKLKTDLGAIMVGHMMAPHIDPDWPTSISPRAIKLLRRDVGYQGVICTDDLKMKALSDRYSPAEIALRAVHAGADLLIVAWDDDKQAQMSEALYRAVMRGKIPMSRIDASVRRILELKQKFVR